MSEIKSAGVEKMAIVTDPDEVEKDAKKRSSAGVGEEEMTARTYFFTKSESDLHLLLPGLIISAACHIFLFLGLIFAPGLNFQKNIQPAPINVSLVSIPASYFTPPAKKKTKTASTRPKQAVEKPVKVPKVEKTAIEKPVQEEYRPKASLKKKTFKTGKVVENAIKEIEKK